MDGNTNGRTRPVEDRISAKNTLSRILDCCQDEKPINRRIIELLLDPGVESKDVICILADEFPDDRAPSNVNALYGRVHGIHARLRKKLYTNGTLGAGILVHEAWIWD